MMGIAEYNAKVGDAIDNLLRGLLALQAVLLTTRELMVGKVEAADESETKKQFLDTPMDQAMPFRGHSQGAWLRAANSVNKTGRTATLRDLLEIPVRDWDWRGIGPTGRADMVELFLTNGITPKGIPTKLLERLAWGRKWEERRLREATPTS